MLKKECLFIFFGGQLNGERYICKDDRVRTEHGSIVKLAHFPIKFLRLNNRGLKRAAAKLERAWSTYCTEQGLVTESQNYKGNSQLSLKTGTLASSRCKKGSRKKIVKLLGQMRQVGVISSSVPVMSLVYNYGFSRHILKIERRVLYIGALFSVHYFYRSQFM